MQTPQTLFFISALCENVTCKHGMNLEIIYLFQNNSFFLSFNVDKIDVTISNLKRTNFSNTQYINGE